MKRLTPLLCLILLAVCSMCCFTAPASADRPNGDMAVIAAVDTAAPQVSAQCCPCALAFDPAEVTTDRLCAVTQEGLGQPTGNPIRSHATCLCYASGRATLSIDETMIRSYASS